MPTVYVLYSLKTGKRYVGSTSRTAAERLLEHNSGKVPFTKKHRPLEIVYTETMASLLLAQKRERFFKTGKGRIVLKSLLSESTCFRATESLARPPGT